LLLRAAGTTHCRHGRRRPARDDRRAALALAPLRAGRPEVVAGVGGLDRPVRWAHVAEVEHIASLLKGGELLLSTGLTLARRAGEQRRWLDGLADRGVSALVVELGAALPALPAALVERAEERGLPLVALRREVAFVEITEAVHSELLARQLGLLRRAEAIHARFTDLMLAGEGADTVLRALADTIADPVVLEDARGALVFHAAHRSPDGDVVAAWEARLEGAYAAAVPGGDGGRLVALPLDSPLDEFDRVAVDRAAGVIALASLRTDQRSLLALRERGGFLAELAAGTLTEREAAGRAEGLGLAAPRAALVPCVVALVPPAGGTRRETEERAAALAFRDVRRALEAERLPAVLGARAAEGDALGLIAPGREGGERERAAGVLARAVAEAVARHFGTAKRPVVVVGAPADGFAAAGAGLADALGAVAPAARLPARPWHDAAAPDLERLLAALGDEPALRRFVERRLGPLLAHDAARKAVLLPTLEAWCAHGGGKAETARALHLGRQALYHRLARIGAVLGGADLDDEDTRLGLHLAVRARRLLDR
jgi:purine catabolism regulator